jgi:hypothetical protein
LTGDLLAPSDSSLHQLASIENEVEYNIIGRQGNNQQVYQPPPNPAQMSMNFEIKEANESQEDSFVVGASSQRLKISK